MKCILQNQKQDLSNKQDRFVGTTDQIVGFNTNGEAIPISMRNLTNDVVSQDILDIWNNITSV